MRFQDLTTEENITLLACETPGLDGNAQDALDSAAGQYGEPMLILALDVGGFRRDFIVAETNEQYAPYDAVLVEEAVGKHVISKAGGVHVFVDKVNEKDFAGYEVYKADENDVVIARFGYNPATDVEVCAWAEEFTS